MRADGHAMAATDTAENGGLSHLGLTVDNAKGEILTDLDAQAAAVAQFR